MDLESLFGQTGAVFCCELTEMQEKLKGIKAFVFDWDGVFNNAAKNENKSSTFNEADSMGTNMLRFSYYLLHGKAPYMALISGERNDMAFYFAEREHYNACYYKVPHKIIALEHFCKQHQIQPSEVCYFFDDVLDLSVAAVAGLRILINRRANPLFKNYIVKRGLADYITGHESGNFAVREACELLMGLNNNFDACMDLRSSFDAPYRNYLSIRQATPTMFNTVDGELIKEGR